MSAIEVLSFIDCELIGCENIVIFFSHCIENISFIVTISDEGWLIIS
jgi:hypothetical protein